MSMDVTKLFQNARVIDPANGVDACLDLLVRGERVEAVGEHLEAPGARVMDCSGLILMPGLVDIHCHLRDPGYEYKEDIASGTMAAARGGFTTVCCMANTLPVNDNQAVTSAIVEKARREGVVRVRPVGAITKGLKGQELAEMGQMKQAGIVAVSDDGRPVESARMMYNALKYAACFDLPVISHCEELSLVAGGSMNEGYQSTVLGLRGIPRAAEEVMVAREIQLAESLNLSVHLAHVSTEGSVQLIRAAKARGVQVTCETMPHYLALTDSAVEGYDTNTRVNPPLRERRDVQALTEALMDGTIDCIATDHAPHHLDEKRVEYELAASGISGFETAFSVCYTHLVASGTMKLSRLVEKMTCAAARVLKLDAGTLTPGALADFVLVNPDEVWTVDPEQFASKGKNTPFAGKTLTSRVKATYVSGVPVFSEVKGA